VSNRSDTEMLFRPGVPPESAGWPGPEYSVATEGGMRIERNVAVPMRDGLRLLVDVYRPQETDRAVPALIAWSPYGKHGMLDWANWPGHGIDLGRLSKYTAFETPDPANWAGQDYAVIMADARGAWGSEGEVTMFGPQVVDACYDLIEWAGTQEWSNGKVGMSGVSWYTVIQWLVAAKRPPHLAAINPWEGFTDLYYEVFFHGGIPETQFGPMIAPLIAFTHGQAEDVAANAMHHPFYDEYWKSKVPDLPQIGVPAYVVAGWSDHGLHTRGTLEGFRRISPEQKWLELHGRKKWAYFYEPASVARQTAFFDHFLKGQDTEVFSWPPVRIEVRDRAYVGQWRDEQEWPLGRTQYTPLYLDARTGSLNTDVPSEESRAAYDATKGRAVFERAFDADTELTGSMKLRLWVETDGADNMDLFVAVQKFDADGNFVPFPFFSSFDDGNVALGWLRVSRRELDEEHSTPEQPRYTHRREQPLSAREIVPVDIEIWPSSTLFHAGERLRLVVQGQDINTYPEGLFAQGHKATVNAGLHVLHTGSRYDAHLLVPVIPVSG
jgi:predicted acyl esterase